MVAAETSISRKHSVRPVEKFPSLVLPGNAMLHHLIPLSVKWSLKGRLKTKERFNRGRGCRGEGQNIVI